MKACIRCGQHKSPDEFYEHRGWRDGRHPYCKPCLLQYQRESRRTKLDAANPNRRRWSRDFVRHDYFREIDNPVKAYVGGLLAADGYVLAKQRRIGLELSVRDRELAVLVRDELAPGYVLRERVREGRRMVIFCITSDELYWNLAQLGIVPRKSLVLEWPALTSASLSRAFLLGYFDGDGFITWSQNGRYRYPRWGLCGTKTFLDDAMRFIRRETGVRSRSAHAGRGQKIYVLNITGPDAFLIDDWLHADTALGLARKRLNRNEARFGTRRPRRGVG